jgi:hypothetical protein
VARVLLNGVVVVEVNPPLPLDAHTAHAAGVSPDDVVAHLRARVSSHPDSPYGLAARFVQPHLRRWLVVTLDKLVLVPREPGHRHLAPVVEAPRCRLPAHPTRWQRTVVGGIEVWIGPRARADIDNANNNFPQSTSCADRPADGAALSWVLLLAGIGSLLLAVGDVGVPVRFIRGLSFLAVSVVTVIASLAAALPSRAGSKRRTIVALGVLALAVATIYCAVVSSYFLPLRALLWGGVAAAVLSLFRWLPSNEPGTDGSGSWLLTIFSLGGAVTVVSLAISIASFYFQQRSVEASDPTLHVSTELRPTSPLTESGDKRLQVVVTLTNRTNSRVAIPASVYRVAVTARDSGVPVSELGIGEHALFPPDTYVPANGTAQSEPLFVTLSEEVQRKGPLSVLLTATLVTADGERIRRLGRAAVEKPAEGVTVYRYALSPPGMFHRLTKGIQQLVVVRFDALPGDVATDYPSVIACVAHAHDDKEVCRERDATRDRWDDTYGLAGKSWSSEAVIVERPTP